MNDGWLARIHGKAAQWLPERRIVLQSGGRARTIALGTGDQLTAAAAALAAVIWTAMATGSMVLGAFNGDPDAAAVKVRSHYERLIADRQARLNAAMAKLDSASGSLEGLAKSVEQRHSALTALLAGLPGARGLALAVAPARFSPARTADPVTRIRTVEGDQDRMVQAAESYAHTRADRLRLALRLAGLDPAAYAGRGGDDKALGGPLIEAKDPRALAAVLDVDESFAARIQRAAQDLDAAHGLDREAERLPLAKPVNAMMRTSTFGVRYDPFTHRPAFHAGQDFAGAYRTPIHATAPGVVSFTGQRTGYGNVVEIDHAGGFKTRYAHLAAFDVRMGQRVGVGQQIAEMGSTGRSTGVHLHYEVWSNGRVQDPTRFLKAGDYVQQNN